MRLARRFKPSTRSALYLKPTAKPPNRPVRFKRGLRGGEGDAKYLLGRWEFKVFDFSVELLS